MSKNISGWLQLKKKKKFVHFDVNKNCIVWICPFKKNGQIQSVQFVRERETEVDRWKDGETHWIKQATGLHEEEEEEEEEEKKKKKKKNLSVCSEKMARQNADICPVLLCSSLRDEYGLLLAKCQSLATW